MEGGEGRCGEGREKVVRAARRAPRVIRVIKESSREREFEGSSEADFTRFGIPLKQMIEIQFFLGLLKSGG